MAGILEICDGAKFQILIKKYKLCNFRQSVLSVFGHFSDEKNDV
jgi:hypothetical protein